ncbi:hypothetical protein OV203_43215 [Nannocystis sp. ILAH1]|uniref:hypothetical protein n=1 Tax=Nannocystis sp. ILAH1 TaxID=2996789 RepID=UPI0022700AA5|nr:hypothetical protein [Nannocystis sp. ILAH1]MCY0994028.1 hypothetical protein [Nannocystis sp. ILAH1]
MATAFVLVGGTWGVALEGAPGLAPGVFAQATRFAGHGNGPIRAPRGPHEPVTGALAGSASPTAALHHAVTVQQAAAHMLARSMRSGDHRK